MTFDADALRPLFDRLANAAGTLEAEARWPANQLGWLAEAGVMQWVIPTRWGGQEIPTIDLMRGYIRLAEACLTTAFILTQRNGACQRIAASENTELQAELLPALARGELFVTTGISHLTTSRRHLAEPAVSVRPTERGYLLNGTVPWVTGAAAADWLVTGGTMIMPAGELPSEEEQQVLLALPMKRPGITVADAAELLALSASCTASIELKDVEVDRRCLLAGPTPRIMQQPGGGGAGSLGTSALAIGVARAAIRLIEAEAHRRPDLRPIGEAFADEKMSLSADLLFSTKMNPVPAPFLPERLRQRANSLVLRSTQAALAVSKGAGFVAGHPAERLVRQALFFLVWSCPQPVLTATLQELATRRS